LLKREDRRPFSDKEGGGWAQVKGKSSAMLSHYYVLRGTDEG